MNPKVSTKGYTNVILVLNMKRFIHPDDQNPFETGRGTREFAQVIRN